MRHKNKNNIEDLNKRFLEEFGMSYDEFNELELHTQLELISNKKEEKEQKEETLIKKLTRKIKKHH